MAVHDQVRLVIELRDGRKIRGVVRKQAELAARSSARSALVVGRQRHFDVRHLANDAEQAVGLYNGHAGFLDVDGRGGQAQPGLAVGMLSSIWSPCA